MLDMHATDKDGRIHKIGDDAHGDEASAGYYVVAPDGRIVVQPPAIPLKDGWRAATSEDLEASIAREHARNQPAPIAEPSTPPRAPSSSTSTSTPVVHGDEHH